MATLTITGLEELLRALGMKVPIPHFAAANVLNKPLDIGRCYFADILSSLVECDLVNAFKSIQWPGGIDSGDLAVILPKLSHGSDANVLAFDLVQKVRSLASYLRLFFFLANQIDLTNCISSQNVHSSSDHFQRASIFELCSRSRLFLDFYCLTSVTARTLMDEIYP
jgi:hypothetical protein